MSFRAEVDFRARLIALESGNFARAARRSVITGADVELARRSFLVPADASVSGAWSALPGSVSARLAVSDGVLRGVTGAGAAAALAATGGGATGSMSSAGAAVASDGREAAGALAGVFSSISDDADATPAGAAVGALTRLAPNTVARALPVIVGALRGVFEAALVGDDSERDGARVLRALALLDALVADARAPLEIFGAEFLALSASAALAAGSAGGGAAPAPPPRLRARARAAAVFARVVARLRGAAPDTHSQAVGLCLDAAANAALTPDGNGRPARVTLSASDTLFAASTALCGLAPVDPTQKPIVNALVTRLEAHWAEAGAPPLNTWAHAAKGALERLKAL